MAIEASRNEMLTELKSLADDLGKTPTAKQMNEMGQYYSPHYQDEFGTWNDAITAAGLDVNQHRATNSTEQDFIDSLQSVADKVERVPRQSDVDEHGEWATTTYKSHIPDNGELSKWNTVLEYAGFEPYYEQHDPIVKNCDCCGGNFKVQPHRENQRFCDYECYWNWRSGRFTGVDNWSYNSIQVNCATCGKQLKRTKSRFEDRENHFCDHDCYAEWISEHKTGKDAFRWSGGSTTYGAGWTQQKKRDVRERDDYRCQACGKTQSQQLENIGRKLSVHHIIPAKHITDAEKRNAMDNLVTLCFDCHRKWEGIPLRPKLKR